jgi:hypothetical protein
MSQADKAKNQTAGNGPDTSEEARRTKEVERQSALAEMVPEIMSGSAYSREALAEIDSFDAALAMATEQYGPVVDAADVLGDGFALLESNSKPILEGIPLILMEWNFRDGDFGKPFVSVRVVAKHPNGTMGRYIVNDGSTGIAEQLAEYTKKYGRYGGLIVSKGLLRSDYDVEIDGKKSRATTWYLNLSKKI